MLAVWKLKNEKGLRFFWLKSLNAFLLHLRLSMMRWKVSIFTAPSECTTPVRTSVTASCSSGRRTRPSCSSTKVYFPLAFLLCSYEIVLTPETCYHVSLSVRTKWTGDIGQMVENRNTIFGVHILHMHFHTGSLTTIRFVYNTSGTMDGVHALYTGLSLHYRRSGEITYSTRKPTLISAVAWRLEL